MAASSSSGLSQQHAATGTSWAKRPQPLSSCTSFSAHSPDILHAENACMRGAWGMGIYSVNQS